MRIWFLTWTTYGTWLPGDARGVVSPVRQPVGPERRNNVVGTPYDADHKGLRDSARAQQKSDAVWLIRRQASTVVEQFRETALHRGWTLHACSVASNHVHLLVEVVDDPDPAKVLHSFKAYASRRLNDEFGKRDAWWTASGSTRKKADDRSIMEATRYVRDQPDAFVIWLNQKSRFVGQLEVFDREFPKR